MQTPTTHARSFWTLLDPTYAKKFIPIVASVSEHQPTTWASYIFDLHALVFAAPLGLYYCFKKLTGGGHGGCSVVHVCTVCM